MGNSLPLKEPGLVIYGSILSPVTMTTRAYMYYVKANFKDFELDGMSAQHQSKAYVQNVNPRAQMPAIKDGDYTLYEGMAICKYVGKCSTYEIL